MRNRTLFAFWFTFSLCVPCLSYSSVINFSGQAVKVLSANGIRVPIYPLAHLDAPSSTQKGYSLYLTGAGIYVKQVGIFNVPVYAAASYTDNKNGISTDEPLDSLKNAKAKVIQLTSFRALSYDDIRYAWEEMLNANGIDVNESAIHDMLSKIVGVSEGDVTTLINYGLSADETVLIESTATSDIIEKAEGLGLKLWSGWFGIAFDNGMAALKNKLTGKVPLTLFRHERRTPFFSIGKKS